MYEKTFVESHMKLRGIWDEVLTGMVGTKNRNTTYSDSISDCGPGFMGYTNCA